MRKADNLPPSCTFVTKSGSLNFLEPSGPLQASNGTALPLPPITDHEGTQVKLSYRSTVSLTFGIDKNRWLRSRSDRFTPGKQSRYAF